VRVTPFVPHAPAVLAGVLRSGGWDEWKADAAAQGTEVAALRVSGLDAGTIEELVRYAGRTLGLEVQTGESWAVILGTRARLQALARPWTGPPALAELAHQLGLMLPVELPVLWPTARGTVSLARPVLVGILNLTPDSFSDGGALPTVEAAVAHAERLLEGGATVLDVGGESTRPGRPAPVPEAEELGRVLPVVHALVRRWPALLVSVDTVKSRVARAAIDAGAAIINDVSAFRLDAGMAKVAAETGAGVVLMHSRGGVSDMATYEHADYGGDVVGVVLEELRASVDGATASGILPDRIVVDPGLGFSKTVEQNILLADQLGALRALGRPVLVGPSRKRFLGAITGRELPDRDRATAALCALAYERGARLFRIHDPTAAMDALRIAHALGEAP
jgi:dihydropteroate synthase